MIASLGVVLAFMAIVCGQYRVECAGSIRHDSWYGHYVSDRPTGIHQHRCGDQRLAEQGIAAAVHQLRRIEFGDDAWERVNITDIASYSRTDQSETDVSASPDEAEWGNSDFVPEQRELLADST